MKLAIIKWSLFLFTFILIIGCNEKVSVNENINLPSIKDVTDSAWQNLSKQRIYFGHQSVGDNILEGINSLMADNEKIKLDIKNYNDMETFAFPVFSQSYIGKNEDIDSKLQEFSKNISGIKGGQLDIAFMKLCFWDIKRYSDVNEIFEKYKKAMSELKNDYPNTKFIYLTIPLMSHSNSIIDNLKRLIRPDNGDLDNIKRNELNKLIVHEYKGKEPLFDIALIESTRPDGKRAVFLYAGKEYYYLPDEYTNDGGHLNKYASKYVAEQLLIMLANIH